GQGESGVQRTRRPVASEDGARADRGEAGGWHRRRARRGGRGCARRGTRGRRGVHSRGGTRWGCHRWRRVGQSRGGALERLDDPHGVEAGGDAGVQWAGQLDAVTTWGVVLAWGL